MPSPASSSSAPCWSPGSSDGGTAAELIGFVAVLLASINVFGGFLVTHRMLSMFKKKKK